MASKKLINNTKRAIGIINNIVYFLYVYFIIYILFLSGIIYYINSIKDCSCFNTLNSQYGVNIKYIHTIEIILLVFIVFALLGLISFQYSLNKSQKGGFSYFNLVIFIIPLVIYGYLIYNIYLLSKIPDDKCDCMKSWLKNLLYVQVVLIVIGIIIQGNNLIKST